MDRVYRFILHFTMAVGLWATFRRSQRLGAPQYFWSLVGGCREGVVIPWYKRFQIEIGGRWQAVPDRNTSFRQWLFDPFFGFTYPGKIIKGRQELPDGEVFGGLEILGNKEYMALVWWLRAGIRVLGLDVGMGIFIRSKKSVDKLLSTTVIP